MTARPDFLVTGASGQLGRALLQLAARRGRSAVGATHAELAVEDQDAVRKWVGAHRPRFVLHCGAWTNVDGCEADPAKADRCNGHGTAYVAESCVGNDCGLVYLSTDFVFDGEATSPYRVDDPPNPVSAYGRSKRLGEEAVLRHGRADFHVVRTSWVFGAGGANFPRAIAARARSGQPLQVVTDQVGRPTFAQDLAEALLDLCEASAQGRPGARGGIWHAANEGQCDWHTFAREILAAIGLGDVAVGRTTAKALGRPARRPAYSVLDTSKLDALRSRRMPDYHDALARYLREERL